MAPLRVESVPEDAISAPPAIFELQGVSTIRAEVVLLAPPAKFELEGLGKGVLTEVLSAPPAVFELAGYGRAYVVLYVDSPPAQFWHNAIVAFVDSYKPPAHLTDFLNMTAGRRILALSYDKQHAFDMGPVERGNIDEGLMARAWRLRVDGRDVYLAVADERNSWWEEEFVEFQLPHSPVWSMDLTFDQNGRPFACWECQGEVWIYWHDPVAGSMQIMNVCTGRTPRARLDARQRHQLPDSDIYLFYLNDADDRMEYRIQRDRYDTAYATNLVDVGNVYLEVLASARNYRLYIWLSEYLPENEGTHNPAYRMIWRHSAVYPYYFTEEVEILPDTVTSAGHVFEFISWTLANEDAQLAGDDILTAVIREAMLQEGIDDILATLFGDDILGSVLREAIIIADELEESATLSGDNIKDGCHLTRKIIEVTCPPEDAALLGDDITAGILTENS